MKVFKRIDLQALSFAAFILLLVVTAMVAWVVSADYDKKHPGEKDGCPPGFTMNLVVQGNDALWVCSKPVTTALNWPRQ